VIILVFLPIVLPVIEKLQLGFSRLDLLLWVGTVTAVNMQTAYLSPPVAMSAYYLRNVVPQWTLGTIYKGMADYMVIQIFVLLVLLLYPKIALWLPHVVRYGGEGRPRPPFSHARRRPGSACRLGRPVVIRL
jgi:TRAP-type mannitol/chloroaromatic compound transport system permease large subunit